MADFSPVYKTLGIRNLRAGLRPAMTEFDEKACRAIEAARSTAVAKLKSLDRDLQPAAYKARANAILYEAAQGVQDTLAAEAASFGQAAATYRARLSQAVAPKAGGSMVEALRWELQVDRLQRQLERVKDPATRIKAALVAAETGNPAIVAALEGAIVPLVPADIVGRVRAIAETKAAPVDAQLLENVLNMEDEAARVAFQAKRAVIEAVAAEGFGHVGLDLHIPSPLDVTTWNAENRAAFALKFGYEALHEAIKNGRIPPTPEELETRAEFIQKNAEAIVESLAPKE